MKPKRGAGKRVKSLLSMGQEVPREEALPLLMARVMTQVRFLDNGCWEWTGNVGSCGYAEATLQSKSYRVNRFMCEVLAGPKFDPALDACHSCHNRLCINPWHLRQDTHAANLAESSAAGRINGQQLTHCKRGHPLTPDNLLKGKQFRCCSICSRGRYRMRLGWPEDLAFTLPSGAKGYRPPGVKLFVANKA